MAGHLSSPPPASRDTRVDVVDCRQPARRLERLRRRHGARDDAGEPAGAGLSGSARRSSSPEGAGLSSSAALEMAAARRCLLCRDRRGIPRAWRISRSRPRTTSSACVRRHGPVRLGVGVEGAALLLDCRWLEWKTRVPLHRSPASSRARHGRAARRLTTTAYNDRRGAGANGRETAVAAPTTRCALRCATWTRRCSLKSWSNRMDRGGLSTGRVVFQYPKRRCGPRRWRRRSARVTSHTPSRLMNESAHEPAQSLRGLITRARRHGGVGTPRPPAAVLRRSSDRRRLWRLRDRAGQRFGLADFMRDVASGYHTSIGRTVKPCVVTPSAGARLV